MFFILLRSAFFLAIFNAFSWTSIATTSISGNSCAMAIPIAPLPVPTSNIRFPLGLSTFFNEKRKVLFPELTLEKSKERLQKHNFDIIYCNEYYPILKFYDLGAIAYFAKIIEWEFEGFSVEKYIDKFLILQEELKKIGYISSKQHRFIIVAKKWKKISCNDII